MRSYKIYYSIVAGLLLTILNCPAQGIKSKSFTCGYNVSLKLPSTWNWDSKSTIKTKVNLAKMMFNLKTNDGKIRLLNTGTAPASPLGYARVRLSILSNAQLSQKELLGLTELEISEMKVAMLKEMRRSPIKFQSNSLNITKTRVDTKYLSIRTSYIRSGLNGSVKVDQYNIPFSNRAVLLTLSYNLSKQEMLAPILLRILSSLKLNDEILWPSLNR